MASWITYAGKLVPYQDKLPHKNLTAVCHLLSHPQLDSRAVNSKAYEEAVMWSDSQTMNSVTEILLN